MALRSPRTGSHGYPVQRTSCCYYIYNVMAYCTDHRVGIDCGVLNAQSIRPFLALARNSRWCLFGSAGNYVGCRKAQRKRYAVPGRTKNNSSEIFGGRKCSASPSRKVRHALLPCIMHALYFKQCKLATRLARCNGLV